MGQKCLVKQPLRRANRGPAVLGMAWEGARNCREAAKAGPAWGDRNECQGTARTMGKRLMLAADTGHNQGPHGQARQ